MRCLQEAQERRRIYRKANIAHALIDSVFAIRLCALWFGLSLTPLTAGCACCWLVGGIQRWEDVPILPRISVPCSALTAGSSCLVQPGLTQQASQQQEGKCSGKYSGVVMADFSLTSALKLNNLQTHPFILSGHFAKQLEQPWKKHARVYKWLCDLLCDWFKTEVFWSSLSMFLFLNYFKL